MSFINLQRLKRERSQCKFNVFVLYGYRYIGTVNYVSTDLQWDKWDGKRRYPIISPNHFNSLSFIRLNETIDVNEKMYHSHAIKMLCVALKMLYYYV